MLGGRRGLVRMILPLAYGGTVIDSPWEPPLAGTEAEHLVGAPGRLRMTFRWKTADLDAAGLRVRIGA